MCPWLWEAARLIRELRLAAMKGRALKAGDALSRRAFTSVEKNGRIHDSRRCMKPDYNPDKPLGILVGLQADFFTEEGLKTLFESEYTLSSESDRMGCRALKGRRFSTRSGC